MTDLLDLTPTALLDEARVYRYLLTRTWAAGPRLCWVMLNPSTADATVDDATIRRVVRFTRGFDYGGAVVVNLYALRSRDPALLADHPDPVGPRNDAVIAEAVRCCGGAVVAAWGASAMATRRAAAVRALLPPSVTCLGVTAAGAPRHPLYVATGTQLVAFGRPGRNRSPAAGDECQAS